MAWYAMTITLVCPICDKPLVEFRGTFGYSLMCHGADGHVYGALAASKTDVYAILAPVQKRLVDALSAKIALPIEQRRRDAAAPILADMFCGSMLPDLERMPPRTFLYDWERRALDWLREWRKAGGDTPINWWTSSYMNYGPPPWGDKP
jgi:hypothetical protein